MRYLTGLRRRTGTPRAEAAPREAEAAALKAVISAGPTPARETDLLAESRQRLVIRAFGVTTASPWGSGSTDRLPPPYGPDPLVFGDPTGPLTRGSDTGWGSQHCAVHDVQWETGSCWLCPAQPVSAS